MKNVYVIGGGPAGMMAAVAAAAKGHRVTLIEQNEKTGKKLFITGKGRCNVTNACDTESIFGHVTTNRKFLYSAVYGFTNEDLCSFLESRGCKLKTERGNRVFPVSDHSSDVIKTLDKAMKDAGVQVRLQTVLTDIRGENGVITEISLQDKATGRFKKEAPDALILCSGGLSYPVTGSDGSVFSLVRALGHTVTPLMPSLVPFETEDEEFHALSGLSLKNVNFAVKSGKKILFEELGEILFTHFGLSGPSVLTASTRVSERLFKGEKLTASIDMKPALSVEKLDERLLRDFKGNENKQIKNVMGGLVPQSLILPLLNRAQIQPDTFIRDLRKEERGRGIAVLKNLEFTLTGTRGFSEAIITKGGVDVREVNSTTMQSKLYQNLYFAGEMLDLDAETGGFNLQIAWSTGYAAGSLIE